VFTNEPRVRKNQEESSHVTEIRFLAGYVVRLPGGLAGKLGVSKQQVQRDEDSLYKGASLQRLSTTANIQCYRRYFGRNEARAFSLR
jgi:hypothetical protein